MSSASLAGSPVQYDPYDQFNAYQQQGMAQNMYGHHHGYASPPPGQAVYVQQQFPMAPAIQQQHRPGLLPQGTAIVIGEHTVVVDKFLSEGALRIPSGFVARNSDVVERLPRLIRTDLH